ncbi:hypothetical protein [Qipengyuania sp. DGS5-3]|uniref:hypothetical protein n=1 Tax=Qipengyuania sp. DGS5-3 TaxID=3349632 RepID=UPI0036D2D434
MKSTYLYASAALAATFGLAACIPSAAPPPAATSASVAAPAPEPTRPVVEIPSPPAVPAIPGNWLDQAQTAGDWEYERERSESFAIFSTSREAPAAIIRCDLGTRMVGIGQFTAGTTPQIQMKIQAETNDRMLIASTRASSQPLYAAELSAQDPLLDAIALTRGRFAIAVSGKPVLYLPAWGEVTRVIEDCR